MRYYIYLDKCFIRSLFSIIENANFNIEVVEYSVRKSLTTNNQISISPSNEKICNIDKDSTLQNKEQVHFRNENICKNCVSTQAGYGDSSTIETQRRYINIDDITDMKNNNFYHNLIERLNSENFRNGSRIKVDEGFIRLYDRYDIDDKVKLTNEDTNQKGNFFMLNGKYIWYDNKLLKGDIELLAQMSCKIKVVGYKINCLDQSEEIIKAIAMFIE